MHLYRFCLKVRPAAHHPSFFEWQFGLLNVWLAAQNLETAMQMARGILDQLPYEPLPEGTLTDVNPLRAPLPPPLDVIRAEVLRTGLALRLESWQPGADEAAFEAMRWPDIPPRQDDSRSP